MRIRRATADDVFGKWIVDEVLCTLSACADYITG